MFILLIQLKNHIAYSNLIIVVFNFGLNDFHDLIIIYYVIIKCTIIYYKHNM